MELLDLRLPFVNSNRLQLRTLAINLIRGKDVALSETDVYNLLWVDHWTLDIYDSRLVLPQRFRIHL